MGTDEDSGLLHENKEPWVPNGLNELRLLLAFCLEVERRAENKMALTLKLEGAHYAAMCELRNEVREEVL